MAREPSRSECPAWDTGVEKLRCWVSVREEESGDGVASHFIVGELGSDLERVIDPSAQDAVATQPVEGSGIDRADGINRVATGQRELGETQHGKVAGIGCAAIRLPMTTNQAEPHLLHGVSVAERDARNAATHKEIDDHRAAKQLARARVLGEVG